MRIKGEARLNRTYFAKKNEIEKKWYLVDATDIPLGRLASRVAHILRGKHKPEFTPHVDCGDYVIVVNASKIRLTGKKATDKFYYRHTGYPGHLKKISYGELLGKNPKKMVQLAVRRMLPKNRLGRQMINKLKVYRGSEHPHSAQKPEKINILEFVK